MTNETLIALARSRYIELCLSDDWVHPHRLGAALLASRLASRLEEVLERERNEIPHHPLRLWNP